MTRASVTNRAFAPADGSFANDPMLYLTRLFVYFLQNLFRDYPEGCGMHWDPNYETTELVITAEKPEIEVLEKTPHLTCILGAGRWTGTGFDQMQKIDMVTGQRTHTDLIPMTMAYHCQAKEGMVARRLAWNASFYTNALRRVLMKAGRLHHVAVNHEIGPESAATAYSGPTAKPNVVSVVVTVPFYWQPQWIIKEPSEVWRRVIVNLAVYKGRPLYMANTINPPRVKGRPVVTRPLSEPEVAYRQEVWDSATDE